MHIYTYTNTHTYVYAYTYIHTYIYTNTWPHICIYINTWIEPIILRIERRELHDFSSKSSIKREIDASVNNRAFAAPELMSHGTHINNYKSTAAAPVEAYATGRRRVIGCLKLQVIRRKRATLYSALWREMTCRDKASYDSTLPCMAHMWLVNRDSLPLEKPANSQRLYTGVIAQT